MNNRHSQQNKSSENQPINSNYRFALKNGRVGQQYSDELDFDKAPIKGKILNYEIDGLDKIGGLQLFKEERIIKGIPITPGSPEENYCFLLVILYETEFGEKSKRELSIKILPDPKTLWKNLEPPNNIEDRKEHVYSKIISFKENIDDIKNRERTILAASTRGRSHAHSAKFRDDHVKINYIENEKWSIIAVADGAGSAELSRVGSSIVCKTAVDYITKQLIEVDEELTTSIKNYIDKKQNNLNELLYNILASASLLSHNTIINEALNRNKSIRDFNTTLLLAIYKKFEFGYFIAGFWVGDGALVIYEKNKFVQLLGNPDSGEYSGETHFITEKSLMTPEILSSRIKFHIPENFTALIAMSDGISDPMFTTERNLKDIHIWDELWDNLTKNATQKDGDIKSNLLEWLNFWVEGEHDDRTIAILY